MHNPLHEWQVRGTRLSHFFNHSQFLAKSYGVTTNARVKYPQIERFTRRIGLDTLHSQPEEQRPPRTLLAPPAERKWIFVPPGPSRGAQSGASSSRPPNNTKDQ